MAITEYYLLVYILDPSYYSRKLVNDQLDLTLDFVNFHQ